MPFIRAYTSVLNRKDLTSSEKLVLSVICRYWPSPFWGANATIADILGFSVVYIEKLIKRLKQKGLIKAGYTHRNRDGKHHTVRVIVPLCLTGKCVLSGMKISPIRLAGMSTVQEDGEVPSNQTQTPIQSYDLLERNRRKNIKATSLTLPALGQSKPLAETPDTPPAAPIVRNFAQVLKGTLNSFDALSENECQRRRLEQIKRLKVWA